MPSCGSKGVPDNVESKHIGKNGRGQMGPQEILGELQAFATSRRRKMLRVVAARHNDVFGRVVSLAAVAVSAITMVAKI